MKSGLSAGFIAVFLTFAATAATPAPVAQKPLVATAADDAVFQKTTQAARPFSAVLRYGPGTAAGCQSLSDNSSAICLLLALHVIELSKKRVTETRL